MKTIKSMKKNIKVKRWQPNPTFVMHNTPNLTVIKIKFQENDVFGSNINLIPSPTANCQLFSIQSFSYLYEIMGTWNRRNRYNYLNSQNCKYINVNHRKFMYNFANRCVKALNKKIALIDLQEKYQRRFEMIFDERFIISKQPYISTNSSRMCLYLINFSKFIDHYSRKYNKKKAIND